MHCRLAHPTAIDPSEGSTASNWALVSSWIHEQEEILLCEDRNGTARHFELKCHRLVSTITLVVWE